MAARSPLTRTSSALRSRTSIRSFSSTTSRPNATPIPSFATTSAPLQTHLDLIRSRIFLPSRLSKTQRDLIFKTKNHAMLLNDPLSVSVGDESFELQPLDRMKDLPNTWKSITATLKLLESSPDDWAATLPNLLEGVHQTRRRIRPEQYAVVVRAAGQAGAAHVVLECVRGAKRTGLFVRELGVAREFFYATREKARLAQWEPAATAKALAYAEQGAVLLEDEQHCGKREFAPGADPRRAPEVVGVLLELAATVAKTHASAREKTAMYVRRLLPLVGDVEAVREGRRAAAREITRWVPVLRGLRLAKDVLGSDVPGEANGIIERLQDKIAADTQTFRNAEGKNHERKLRCLEWVEEL